MFGDELRRLEKREEEIVQVGCAVKER